MGAASPKGEMRPKMEKGEYMKLSQIGKIALPLALAGTLVGGAPLEALACTQVWMPDSLTAEKGTWYFGRSEDGGYRGVKIFGVEPAHDAGFKYHSEETSFEWTSPTPTYRYTYVRDHGNNWAYDITDGINTDITNAYSAAGVNQWGVSCSATLSVYPQSSVVGGRDWEWDEASQNWQQVEVEGWDPLNSDSGIGEYNYASIILGQSKTAREGVELIGKLVEDYGACSNDQIIISDAKESWLLMVLSGHEWLAFQLPENQASVNPNIGGLDFKVDLSDPDVLHSEGIVSKVPTEKLKSFEDGTPDIDTTYFGTKDGGGSWSRYAMGRVYFGSNAGHKLEGNRITDIDDLSLFFTPGRSNYSTYDMIRALAARGEGSDLDANATGLDPIGKSWSLETHIFEVKRGMDPEIATVQWLALSRDEFSVAIPNYSALLTQVNKHYGSFATLDSYHQDGNDGSTWSGEDSEEAAKQAGEWDNYLPYVMMDINTLATHNRDNVATGLRAYLDALQNELIAQHDQVEAAMVKAPKEERQALANKAADVAAEKTWERCNALLQELRAYVKGDQAEPFQASDYDAAAKGLVEPFAYAAEVVPAEPEPTDPEKPAVTAGTWMKSSGKWWYAHNDGGWATGWEKIDGAWYRFDKDGWMQTGWVKTGGQWYYLKDSGAMASGWQKVGGKWYLLGGKDDGAMKSGWQKVGGKWYLLGGKDDGAMRTGWQKVGGTWYYLYSSGAMAASTWVGPYWVNASGAWTRTR